MVLSDPPLPDCPMVAVNPAFEAVTGYTAADSWAATAASSRAPAPTRMRAPRIRACLEAGQGCIEWIVNYRKRRQGILEPAVHLADP